LPGEGKLDPRCRAFALLGTNSIETVAPRPLEDESTWKKEAEKTSIESHRKSQLRKSQEAKFRNAEKWRPNKEGQATTFGKKRK